MSSERELDEGIKSIKSAWRREHTARANLEKMLEQAEAENAKLRGLLRMMWKPFCWAQSGYDVCLTDEQDRAIRDMARELGVEVD